jgi:hypothetical protein
MTNDCINSFKPQKKFRILTRNVQFIENMDSFLHSSSQIPKWNFKKWDGKAWTGLIWLRTGTGGGLL